MTRKRKILIGGAITLAVVVGIGGVHHFRVKGVVKRYKAELMAHGEQLSIDEVSPPTVPLVSNSAALFLSVTTNFVDNGALATNGGSSLIMVAPGRATAGWAQPWFGDGDLWTFSNSWEEALTDLWARNNELNRLVAITDRPVLQFDTDHRDGWFDAVALMPAVAGMKSTARLLGSAAQCELNQGNSVEAGRFLCAELTIIEASTEDRWLITQLVRAAVAAMAAHSTWALLQSTDPSDADLKVLQDHWNSMEFVEHMTTSFQMELAVGINAFQRTRESRHDFDQIAGYLFAVRLPRGQSEGETPFLGLRKGWARLKFHLGRFFWHYWWSYSGELAFLKQNQNVLEQCRAAAEDGNGVRARSIYEEFVSSNRIRESTENWNVTGFNGLRNLFRASGISGLNNALKNALRAETIKQLTVTAIALRRYQLTHGAYPMELTELVQAGLLDQHPVDPMDGELLRYKQLPEGGFALYSVGDDRVDDGGDPNWIEDRPERSRPPSGYYQVKDWVWPRHASQAEMLRYWEERIKENYFRVFPSAHDLDPGTEVQVDNLEPMVDPDTGEWIRNPETGRAVLAEEPERSAREWKNNIEHLARQWTDDYFRTLTNSAKGQAR